MINIKTFVFNFIQTNTYVLYDETKECVIIDSACNEDIEREELKNFITEHGLLPKRLLNTHCHVDHIIGNQFIIDNYNIGYEAHADGKLFWEMATEFGSVFNFKINDFPKPVNFLKHGDKINFGVSELDVVYTPGHADGSICFINRKQKFIIVGDVLFKDSIGRTDLPTGNYDVLIKSIKNQLFTLDDDFIVYTGHGPSTTIGYEKKNNQFLKGI